MELRAPVVPRRSAATVEEEERLANSIAISSMKSVRSSSCDLLTFSTYDLSLRNASAHNMNNGLEKKRLGEASSLELL